MTMLAFVLLCSSSIGLSTPGQLLATINNPEPQSAPAFGNVSAGDSTRIYIGNPGWVNDTGTTVGAVYEYDATSFTLIRKLVAPSPTPYMQFGDSICVLDASRVAIGAHSFTGYVPVSSEAPGKVYVFNESSTVPLTTLQSPSPANGDHFGFSLSTANGRLTVGEPHIHASNSAIRIFDANSYSLQRSVTCPSGVGAGWFGVMVRMSGDRVAVIGEVSSTYYGWLVDASTGSLIYQPTASSYHEVLAPLCPYGSVAALGSNFAMMKTFTYLASYDEYRLNLIAASDALTSRTNVFNLTAPFQPCRFGQGLTAVNGNFCTAWDQTDNFWMFSGEDGNLLGNIATDYLGYGIGAAANRVLLAYGSIINGFVTESSVRVYEGWPAPVTPSAPGAVSLSRLPSSGGTSLSWPAVTNARLTRYEVQRRLTGGSFAALADVAPGQTSYTDSTTGAPTADYQVRAVNLVGPSNFVSAAPVAAVDDYMLYE